MPLYHRARAALQIVLMLSLLPITLTYILIETVRCYFRPVSEVSMDNPQGHTDTIKHIVVLTGGKMSKTLHLCRCLRQYADTTPSVQVKIIVLEQRKFRWNATRASQAVDIFLPITSPRESPSAYMTDIINACKDYKATHFLPVAAPVEAVYDAQLKTVLEREIGTKSLHMDHELCRILDDKHKFGSFLRDTIQIDSLRSHQVSSDEEARQFNEILRQEAKEGTLKRAMILKNLAYDPIHRLDLFQLPCPDGALNAYLRKIRQDGNPISKEQPWQLQDFLRDGKEYAAMIVVRDNHMVALTCAESSASQLNYVHVEIPAIRQWVHDFMQGLQQEHAKNALTGQLCFDFMVVQENDKDVAYPIECNPRVHTQCTIYNSPKTRALFGRLLLQDGNKDTTAQKELVEQLEREYPAVNKAPHKETFWFYNEFFKIFPNNWLLKYNDDKDHVRRSKMILQSLPSWTLPQAMISTLYIPSMLVSLALASPILLCFVLVSLWNDAKSDNAEKSSTDGLWTRFDHAYVILLQALRFMQRRLVDSMHNVEADFIPRDPWPLLVKNHVQVVLRLAASLRTGVEWKKLDFAIGKVVEVGGD